MGWVFSGLIRLLDKFWMCMLAKKSAEVLGRYWRVLTIVCIYLFVCLRRLFL